MTSEVVMDIETNAIDDFATLEGLRTIHCIGVSKADGSFPRLYGPLEIEQALDFLAIQDVLIGHNLTGFDIPAIKALYPDWRPQGLVRDTLVMTRLAHPDRKNEDWGVPEAEAIPKQLRGSHSLKAWGHRLGLHKAEFGETTNWEEYTDEMGEYCLQDVAVTAKLWEYLKGCDLSLPAVETEHDFAVILQEQSKNGFWFDIEAAYALYTRLVKRRDELERELQEIFPPATVKMRTPQYYRDPEGDARYALKKEAPAKRRPHLIAGPLKEKTVPFNPGSRSQIARAFTDKYGWEPSEFTADGRAKVDEAILGSLPYAEAKPLAEYLMIVKRLGQLADGNEAYIKLEKGGKLHGRVNHYGTVTGRCSHSRPNLAQCVSVRAPYGVDFRSLFVVPDGYVLVGCDAAQLELRCLAHYMQDADYIKEIVGGDIHSRNQAAAGLPTRDIAKVFAYAVCYGAGAHKLGQIVGGTSKDGGKLRARFLRNVPALKNLIDRVQQKAAMLGRLRGLLGQDLPVRSQHKALNTLIQGAGASIMKVATIEMHSRFRQAGYGAEDVTQVAHIHDEVQFQVRKELAEEVGKILVGSIKSVDWSLGLRCPMDGEYRVGRSWAETH